MNEWNTDRSFNVYRQTNYLHPNVKHTIYFALALSLVFRIAPASEDNPPLNVSMDTDSKTLSSSGSTVSYADVLDKATPSVVAVYTARFIETGRSWQIPDILHYYFNLPHPAPEADDRSQERKEHGVGSGVIISADGYILTNHHVVQGAGRAVDEIKVRLEDGTEYEARLIGSDSKTDVAVLKIEEEKPLPAIDLTDSDQLRVGDIVFAIGNPLDVGLTVTQGIVSALERNRKGQILGRGSYENFIQTDAAINLGNSGGALTDARGRLVGINTAIVSGSGGNIGIGFAIPVNMALDVAQKLITFGEVSRGMLGVFPDDLSPDVADAFGLGSTQGALVSQVQENSPASEAGILHGDFITHVNEIAVTSASKLRLTVSQFLPGTQVNLTLIRRGQTMVVPITLGNLSDKLARVSEELSPLEGVSMRPLDARTRDEFSIPNNIHGVLVTNVGDSSPFLGKLHRLMVLLEVNGKSVDTPKDIWVNLLRGRQNRFYVWYSGRKFFVIVRI